MGGDRTHLLINTLGADRLGIVSDMTKQVVDNGGSVGESQALKLGSQFSLTMAVSIPSNNVQTLTSSLSQMEGLTTQFVEESPQTRKQTVGYSGRFILHGADQPGLVHKVTSILQKHGLGVDVMETMEEEAPFGGTTLFHIDGIAVASKPLRSDFDSAAVQEELQKLGEKFNCDIDLIHDVGRKERITTDVWENIA